MQICCTTKHYFILLLSACYCSVIKKHAFLLQSYEDNMVRSRVDESLTLTAHEGKSVLGEIVF